MKTLIDAARDTGFRYETSDSGRWVRLLAPSGKDIYVAEYSWSDDCAKHYVIFASHADEIAPVQPAKYISIDDALEAAQSRLRTPDRATPPTNPVSSSSWVRENVGAF